MTRICTTSHEGQHIFWHVFIFNWSLLISRSVCVFACVRACVFLLSLGLLSLCPLSFSAGRLRCFFQLSLQTTGNFEICGYFCEYLLHCQNLDLPVVVNVILSHIFACVLALITPNCFSSFLYVTCANVNLFASAQTRERASSLFSPLIIRLPPLTFTHSNQSVFIVLWGTWQDSCVSLVAAVLCLVTLQQLCLHTWVKVSTLLNLRNFWTSVTRLLLRLRHILHSLECIFKQNHRKTSLTQQHWAA